MELNVSRRDIDAIDDQMTELFARRMDCSREISLTKQILGSRMIEDGIAV